MWAEREGDGFNYGAFFRDVGDAELLVSLLGLEVGAGGVPGDGAAEFDLEGARCLLVGEGV